MPERWRRGRLAFAGVSKSIGWYEFERFRQLGT
jgi:hypothetical protein